MNTRLAIQWFKHHFHQPVHEAIGGTPFTLDLIAAIAVQETGYLWAPLISDLDVDKILPLCVGDTIDSPSRKAFPVNKAALIAEPDGARMFQVARQALEGVAKYSASYRKVAAGNPARFCRGYGIFQYDLQFFSGSKRDPAFFLERRWHHFDECLARLLLELRAKLVRVFGPDKKTLTDEERIYVAIAYNKGSAKVGAGFKQGHYNKTSKRYYGEYIADYLALAQTIPSVAETDLPIQPAITIVREEPVAPLATGASAPAYPGRLLRIDSKDTASVRHVQTRLRALGYTEPGANKPRPLVVDGIYGNNTRDAVELFQMRHTDMQGSPLLVDGIVGSDTWAALFGSPTVTASRPPKNGSLGGAVLSIAHAEIGTTEVPPGSNRGARVQEYQKAAGISAGQPWCAAFVYFCFQAAAASLGRSNPMHKSKCRTGGVLDLWNRARANDVPVLRSDAALDDPSLIRPGMVFIMSTGGGYGHTGIVVRVAGNKLETIEGNTNGGGSREGIGVFRHTGRTISSINRGFIDFTTAA